jgi:hypothetical protein
MKQWHYDSVRAVDQAPIDRLRQFPREPDMLVYGLRSLGALIIRGCCTSTIISKLSGTKICGPTAHS